MALSSKQKIAKLRRILENHAAWEVRTLADIHVAGFDFRTIDRARRYLAAHETLARLTEDELVDYLMGKESA